MFFPFFPACPKTSRLASAIVLAWAVASCACSDHGTGSGGDGSVFEDAGLDGGADANGPDCREHVIEDVMIPMRDGKELAAFARRPEGEGCRLPTILLQTPYDKENARSLWFDNPQGEPLFESLEYAFVVSDWRGFFASAPAAVQGAQPYGEDGYDTVEWIAVQPWSDGQVGLWGVSALCGQQYVTAVEQPPHLAAAVPIFCQMNTTYEQYYPGGVLRREYLDFIAWYYGASVVQDHPYRDAAWLFLETLRDPAYVQVPMLVVSGWYDLYNTGTFRTFDELRSSSDPAVRGTHRLLIGDWHHFAAGGETTGAGRPLTSQELQYFDSGRRIQRDSLAFFDYHLRAVDNEVAQWEPVRYIWSGESTWTGSAEWPPGASQDLVFNFHADGTLNAASPIASELSFPYDPDDPSPTVGGATLRFDLDHGPHDQAVVLARSDVVVFATAPLTQPLRIAGSIRVQLAVRTSGLDTDFAVRLTDVDENGMHLLVGEGIRRLKLRDSLSSVSPVVPGERYTLVVVLANELAYRFAAGHRVGLIVTSSNHPRFARNPNNGDDFYTDAAASVSVTNTVICDGESRLTLPVN